MKTIQSIANTGASAYESTNTAGLFTSPHIKIPTLNPGAVAKKRKKKKIMILRKRDGENSTELVKHYSQKDSEFLQT